MKSKRTFVTGLSALLAVVLAAVIILPAAAADTYYFAIANGRLFPCTYSYMPMQSDGELLIPSQFLLDAGLGFNSDFKQAENYYTIYNKDRALVFDLTQNSSFDTRWTYEMKVTRLNGVFYLPLDSLSKHFKFSYSVFPTPYGTAVRIKPSSDTTTDKDVMNSLDTQLSLAQNLYKTLNSPAPSPSPSAPVVSQKPSPSPTPQRPAPVVYLSFDVGTGSSLTEVLDVLDEYGAPSTFFVTPERIESSHDEMRRIIGSGHTVGIQSDWDMSSDEITESIMEYVNGANREMRIATLAQTRIVGSPAVLGAVKVSDSQRDALLDQGYRLWEWNIDAKDRGTKAKSETVAANLLNVISSSNGACHVRFTCNDITANALKKLLPQLKQLNTTYYAISEARPPNYRP